MEVVLSPSVVYFFEAHVMCDDAHLEQHFGRFGHIYRCAHLTEPNGLNKTYGFVDYLSPESAERAAQERSQLLYPGQYVRVSKFLPQASLFDLFALGDRQGAELSRRLERAVPEEGSWGGRNPVTGQPRGAGTAEEEAAKVRIPGAMVPKLIGERGKNIAEISRDSKTRQDLQPFCCCRCCCCRGHCCCSL